MTESPWSCREISERKRDQEFQPVASLHYPTDSTYYLYGFQLLSSPGSFNRALVSQQSFRHRCAWPSAPGRGCMSLQIPDPPLAFGQGGSIVVSIWVSRGGLQFFQTKGGLHMYLAGRKQICTCVKRKLNTSTSFLSKKGREEKSNGLQAKIWWIK